MASWDLLAARFPPAKDKLTLKLAEIPDQE
jgi:hypothetical protein